MPMNAAVKAEWLKALRSGEYEQGRATLAQKGDGKITYCCLGVLCDLAVKAGVMVEVKQSNLDNTITYDLEGASLPDSVMEWAGLGRVNPTVHLEGGHDGTVSLAGLNDGGDGGDREPWNFGQIADIIEAQL